MQNSALNTYAVIDSRALPQIEAMLTAADLPEWDRLQRGDRTPAAEVAWCVQLAPEHAFTQWLIHGPGSTLDDWGILVASDASFRPVREHFRDLLEAISPEGVRVDLRWYQAAVLRALLPLFSASQLHDFFGPVSAFGIRSAEYWTWMRVESGGLASEQYAALRPLP